MLPRETSVRQLKKLRQETKGKDIGDITSNDRLNYSVPNLQYIANPVDTGVESWDEFSKKDSQLQTIAFKSKLVNKPLVKHKKEKDLDKRMENKVTEKIKNFEDFFLSEYHSPMYSPIPIKPNFDDFDDWIEKKKREKKIDKFSEIESEEDEVQPVEDKALESLKLTKVKEEKQPEYTMLGKEKEPKSNPLYGIGQTKDYEIKKIAWFNNLSPIDPPTPKERPILNAGQFVNTEKVRGYVNRVEGNKVFVESLDEPMKIVEISLKDAVKPPVEPKETIKKFNEIVEELNKEFLKDKK